MTGDTWFPQPTQSHPRELWMKRSCYPTLRRRLALGSTATVSYLVDLLSAPPTDHTQTGHTWKTGVGG